MSVRPIPKAGCCCWDLAGDTECPVHRGSSPIGKAPKAEKRAWSNPMRLRPNQKPKRLAPKSAKRKSRQPERDACVAAVLERSGGDCEYAGIIPEVRCSSPDPGRPRIEVDEIRGGAYRVTEMYDPDRCMAACQAHHDAKTLMKQEVRRRMGDL